MAVVVVVAVVAVVVVVVVVVAVVVVVVAVVSVGCLAQRVAWSAAIWRAGGPTPRFPAVAVGAARRAHAHTQPPAVAACA